MLCWVDYRGHARVSLDTAIALARREYIGYPCHAYSRRLYLDTRYLCREEESGRFDLKF